MFSIALDITNTLIGNYLGEAFSLDYALLLSHFGASYLGPYRVKCISRVHQLRSCGGVLRRDLKY
jgi:hypothetical protein